MTEPVRSPTSCGAYGGGSAHLTGWIAMAADPPLWISEHRSEGSGSPTLTLVFVHGSLDSSRSFARVVRRLPDLHTVVYDRRGYQRSRGALPPTTDFEGHVDDLLGVIDGRPTVVVGHSYGGSIALGAALRPGPSTIRSLVAFEPPVPWLDHAAGHRDGDATGARWHTIDPDDTEAAGEEAERFFRRMMGDASWDHLPDRAKAERRADGPALVAELNGIRAAEAGYDASALSVPVIYGMGANSADRRRRTVEWLVGHTPEARSAVIPGAGHGAHLTHPDAFADLARAAMDLADTSAATASTAASPTTSASTAAATPPIGAHP
jgi:pimeloyl-ACP methyl ester carboxylesterase